VVYFDLYYWLISIRLIEKVFAGPRRPVFNPLLWKAQLAGLRF